MMRRADWYGLVLLTSALLLAGCALAGLLTRSAHKERQLRNQQLVAHLQLTDLALLTEVHYTRHPTQADWHAPFQDYPLALDHFPSGSFWTPKRPTR